MGNWGHQIVPKLLLFVICWQFSQFSCLPSSIFNGSLPKYATHSFVWVWCLHIVMLMHILYLLMLFISLPPAPFFYDTSEMVPIATPLRRWAWRRCNHPCTWCGWQCQSLMQQLLPVQAYLAPLWACSPPVAATELSREDPETCC